MEVKNCRSCGKLFNYIGGLNQICPNCVAALEEKFQVAKEFLRENKNAGVNEVAEAADVKPSQVEKWVREERLAFADGSTVGFACEQCGASINTGRFCPSCKASLANGLANSIRRPEAPKPMPKEKDGPRMRHL